MNHTSKNSIWMAILSATMLLAGCAIPVTPLAGEAPAPPAVVTEAPAEESPATEAPATDQAADQASAPAAEAGPATVTSPAEPVAAIACSGEPTPAQTEGPYYTANPPQKSSLLEEGMSGERVVVTGYVLDTACQPIPNAVVDFWQADAEGSYDNEGYRLRGYTLTDAEGRYTMETVIPGEYPGRPPHIHVKIQPPGGAVLTSQLYFPGVASNTQDGLFNPALIVELQETAQGKVALFNFVVAN